MDDGQLTLRQALSQHLAENGFAPDGGLSGRWTFVRFGPIPVCIWNTPARKRAAPFHDLNHVVSGYGNDAMGEAEIGAWELASGCKHYFAAWVLNWSALLLGLRSPRRMFAAFVRGRQTENLYDADTDRLLDLPLGVVRSELGLDRQIRPGWADFALFAAVVLLSPVASAIPSVISIVTSPLWFPSGAWRVRRAPA
ncbi:MAG TPA: hypothetical protein VFP54_00810 [Acidimicrobiales bacterium]|nr:hypothetical protein [Acidimicrobiales bacterium]